MVTTRTHLTRIDLTSQFQERLGTKVDSTPIRPTQWFLLIVPTVGISLLSAWAFTFSPPPPYLAGFFSISSLVVVMFVVTMALVAWFAARSGSLRYRESSGLTWVSQVPLFGPLILLGCTFIVSALAIYSICFVIVGVVQNGGGIWGAAPWSAWILGSISVALSVSAWREVSRIFRANIGIRLLPDSVGVNHEHHDLFLYWHQIRNVTVEAVNRGTERKKRPVSCVRIDADDGRVFHVDIVELGSDPNIVAAFMQYYLDRPQERDLLAHPEDAIRRFKDAQA